MFLAFHNYVNDHILSNAAFSLDVGMNKNQYKQSNKNPRPSLVCVHVVDSLRSYLVTVLACWTVSGAWWTAMARLIWTNLTVPCRRNVSGVLSAPKVHMLMAWD